MKIDMNNEETRILNPVEQEKKNEQEVKNESAKTSKVDKVKYAAGGFVAGAAVGVGSSAMAATPADEEVKTEEQPVAAEATVQSEAVAGKTEEATAKTEDTAQTAEPVQSAPNPEDVLVATDEGIRVAQVNDDVSFSQAFADARAQVGSGGAFEWHGKVYSTYYEEEWNSMSAEQKAEYQSKIDYQDITGEQPSNAGAVYQNASSVASVEPEPAVENTSLHESIAADAEMVDNSSSSPMDVKVLGVETVQDENGNPITVAELEIDSHQAFMADIDDDGKMDVMAVDGLQSGNPDGYMTEDDFADIREANIETEDLQQRMYAEQQPETYYAQNDNLPDYMNDADVSMMA